MKDKDIPQLCDPIFLSDLAFLTAVTGVPEYNKLEAAWFKAGDYTHVQQHQVISLWVKQLTMATWHIFSALQLLQLNQSIWSE